MTLDELWEVRANLCYVAFREGTIKYVSLGHDTADKAFQEASPDQDLSLEDRTAIDWVIGEISSVDLGGRVLDIQSR